MRHESRGPPVHTVGVLRRGPGAALGRSFPFRVVHRPWVHVRLAPSICAEAIGKLEVGATCTCAARRGAWLRLAPGSSASGRGEEQSQTQTQTQRWALRRHPEHGEMLRPVK